MFAVQKRDFMGQWVEIYRANMFEDANQFRKGMKGGDSKSLTRIIQM